MNKSNDTGCTDPALTCLVTAVGELMSQK